jgi:hypothetical protein
VSPLAVDCGSRRAVAAAVVVHPAGEADRALPVCSCTDADRRPGEVGRGRRDHIDDAVHRVRAVDRGAGPAENLDGRGLRGVQLEQLVDVAEAGGPYRKAVLEQQECPAGSWPGQHR